VETAVYRILVILLGLLALGVVAVLLNVFTGKSLRTLFADPDKSMERIYGLGLLLLVLVFLTFAFINN
jgi:hypothetical protein